MNFIPRESELQFPPKRLWHEGTSVYEYFLLEWAVKLTVKWVSERGSVQRILRGKQEWAAHLKATYDLNTNPSVKGPRLCRNLAVNLTTS